MANQKFAQVWFSNTSRQELINLHPNWIWGYIKRGKAQVIAGDCDGAMEMLEETEARKGEWGGELLEVYLPSLYRKCGYTDKADEQMAFVLDRVQQHGISDPLNIAALYAGAGNLDEFIRYAEKCIEEQSVNVAVMQLPKDLGFFATDPFHSPEYIELLKQIGFPNN